MVAGAELKRNHPRVTMGSSASVFAQVIMSSLFVILLVLFATNFGMSKLVSSVEAALKQCLGRFPLEGGPIFWAQFWYVKAGFLYRGSSQTILGPVSPPGRFKFCYLADCMASLKP